MLRYIIILVYFAMYPADTAHSSHRSNDCRVDQWACHDGFCIPFDSKCDGVVDCLDESDEKHAFCRNMRCAPNLFRCTYGACVDGDAPCNGIRDCADGSDELLPRCRGLQLEVNGTFTCGNGERIPSSEHCDGARSCADGSDETLASCAGRRCAPYQFQCAYGACVDADAACDAYGKHHCVNGSDEASELCAHKANRPSKLCVLPPYPTHGYYTVDNQPSARPGEQLLRAHLRVTCEPPHSIHGVYNTGAASCYEGLWHNRMPECKKFCELPNDRSVRYTCIVDGETILSEGVRRCEEYEPSGTQVNPVCNDGYHQQVLRIMRCVDGQWDHVVKCDKGRPQDSCGVPAKGETIMIDGTKAKTDEAPWHAGIYDQRNGTHEQICGGSLVTRQLVISAAHCFWDDVVGVLPFSYYAVALGQLKRSWKTENGQRFNVTSIKIPISFSGVNGNWKADIALVFLDKPAEYRHNVLPVCLDLDNREFDMRQLSSGNLGKVAGWGLTSENGDASEQLVVSDLPTVDDGTCFNNSDHGYRRFLIPDKICAGEIIGKALCKGDSGGGLVFRGGLDQPYYLRGVASTRPTDSHRCSARGYTTFTKVFHYAIFIKENIK